MEFSDFLGLAQIDPKDVAMAMHKPSHPATRQALAVAAEERADLFNAYQSTHPTIQERTLAVRPLLAAFVATLPGEMTFVGLFRNEGHTIATAKSLREDGVFNEMSARIGTLRRPDQNWAEDLAGRARFSLAEDDRLGELRLRLVVKDPNARNYMRLAEKTPLQVLEVKRIARASVPIPPWDQVILTAPELPHLPRDWQAHLAAWRGVYLITDQSDGARYVGSAYGGENLLGRWRTHIAGEAGVTKELSRRNPRNFRFSILELLSPAATIEEVTQCEARWMDRLATREFGLNA